MLLAASASLALAESVALSPSPSRDRKVVRRWALPGDPRGVAVGGDGTIYVGLAQPQAVIAVDPRSGAIRKRVVLDHEEIAATKELVTLRTDPSHQRLFIANGSDESATILSLPDLAVLREITMEGETIRDVVPDPAGRYVYLLGRRVHVFDADARHVLRTLDVADPMALAVSANGGILAVIATEDYGNARATAVTLFDTKNFTEIARDPLQTDATIQGAMFANRDRTIVAFSSDRLFEKAVASRPPRAMTAEGNGGAMRMKIDFGDLVNSNQICLPADSGPQIAALARSDNFLVYAERRCSSSGAFSGSSRSVTPASLYGVDAYAIAWDKGTNTLVATDREGFLTIYNMPRAVVAK